MKKGSFVRRDDKHTDRQYTSSAVIHKVVKEVPVFNQVSTLKLVKVGLLKEGRSFKVIDYIYFTDIKGNLSGVLSFSELFSHSENSKAESVMNKKIISVSPETDQEKVAHIALKYGLKSVPVLKDGKLIGVITSNKMISILNRSLQEDIFHFAGIHKSHLEFENTMVVPLAKAVEHRLPWLLVGLIGIILTAGFINLFEGTLEKYLILAFFVPAIVYMSDALGTQHQTLFIRDLAVLGKELKFGYYFLRQTLIAAIIGVVISGLVFVAVTLFWHQGFTAFVISISMFAALMITSFTSLATTLIFYKLGQDPALGSGPLATIISDTTSIIVYLLVAVWLL